MFAQTRVSLSETPVYVAQVLHSHFLPWRCAEYFPFFPRTFHLRMVTGSYQLIGFVLDRPPSVGKNPNFLRGEASRGWAVLGQDVAEQGGVPVFHLKGTFAKNHLPSRHGCFATLVAAAAKCKRKVPG